MLSVSPLFLRPCRSSRCSWAATTGPGGPRSARRAGFRRRGPRAADRTRSTRPASPPTLYRRPTAERLLRARGSTYAQLLQYFKAAQDALGLVGGPVRAPRLEPTTRSARSRGGARRAAGAGRRRRGGPRPRRGRLPHGGDADPRDHGRRRRSRAPRCSSASSTSRRTWTTCGCSSCGSRAGTPPCRGRSCSPRRGRRRLGRLFIEVSGCLPMCGHSTIGVATVLVETGMVAVTEPETVVRLTPRRGSSPSASRWRTAARPATFRNVASFLTPAIGSSRSTAGVPFPTTWPSEATSTRSRREHGRGGGRARAAPRRSRHGDHRFDQCRRPPRPSAG